MRSIFKKTVFYIIFQIINLTKKTSIFNNCELIELNTSRAANLVMESEIFFKESVEDKLYFIFFEKISNKYFFKLFKRKLKKNKKVFFLPSYSFWKVVCNAYFFFSGKNLQKKVTNIRKKANFFNDQKPFLEFPAEDLQLGYNLLKKLGIKKDDKWICVYNRDEGYLNKYIKNKDWSYHNYRNFPISDLKKAISLFIENDYFVIRVGSNTQENLSLNSSKYIDYSKSNLRSDFMDCFLMSRCEMFFGGSSGICMFPASFRRPYFLVNNCPLEGAFSIKRIYPGIFKRIIDLKNNQILSIREMVDRNLCNIFTTDGFKKKNVRCLNNNEEELEEFASEALLIIKEKVIKSVKDFDQIKKNFISEIIKDDLMQNLEYTNPIGKKFLEKTKIN